MVCRIGIVVVCVVSLSNTAKSQGLAAVKPIEGFVCMSLNRTEQQMFDQSARVSVYQEPVSSSRKLGFTAAVAIASRSEVSNGFRKVLLLDGTPGWVESRDLKAWTNPGGNGQICTPSLMSNGRLGYAFTGP